MSAVWFSPPLESGLAPDQLPEATQDEAYLVDHLRVSELPWTRLILPLALFTVKLSDGEGQPEEELGPAQSGHLS